MNKRINNLLKVITILVLLASLLPSTFPNYWLIDILSNFKSQLIFILLLLFVINLFVRKSKVIGLISLALILWNVSFLYNLYFPNRIGELNKLNGTKIICINLLSSNNESEKVIDYVKSKNPDILILLEFNPKWKILLDEVTNQFPYSKTEVRTDNFGIGYFSKIASKASILNFDHTGIPSVKADIELENELLTIIATHPFPPVGQERFNARNFHLKSIAEKRNEFAENLILVGDLNTSSFSKHFKDLLTDANLIDSRNGLGIMPTWPSNNFALQTTLDHFLISDKIDIIQRETGSNIGSDHLPIFMEFELKK